MVIRLITRGYRLYSSPQHPPVTTVHDSGARSSVESIDHLAATYFLLVKKHEVDPKSSLNIESPASTAPQIQASAPVERSSRPTTAARPEVQRPPEPQRVPSSPRVHRPHPPPPSAHPPPTSIFTAQTVQPVPPTSAPRRHHRRPVVSRPVPLHPNMRPNSAALSMSVPSSAPRATPVAQTSLDRWLSRPRGSEPAPIDFSSQSFFSALQSRSWSSTLAQQYGKIQFSQGSPRVGHPAPVTSGIVASPQLILQVADRPASGNGVYKARGGRRYRAAQS